MSFLGKDMIKIKNKKTYSDIFEYAKDIHKGKVKDEEELKGFLLHTKRRAIGESILIIIVVLVEGYLTVTSKISWLIVIISILIIIIYFIYKSKNETKPKILLKK